MTDVNKTSFSKLTCAFLMALVVLIGQLALLSSGIAVADEPAPAIENCGSRLNAPAGSSYQWQISDEANGTYVNIEGATSSFYDITTADAGKYVQVLVDGNAIAAVGPIGKLVTFDLAKGFVKLGEGGMYSGVDSSGNPVSGEHAASNIYVITQSDRTTLTTNNIVFSGNYPDASFDVTLDNVNMGQPLDEYETSAPNGSTLGKHVPTEASGFIHIPAQSEVKNVTLRLKGENIVRYIHYYTGRDNEASSLKITDIGGDGATSGSLYVPVKKEAGEIDEFVAQDLAYNHWNSGIGGDDGAGGNVRNLHLAGGKIQVLTTYGDNCTAIGAGGNDYAEILISGGEIVAHSNGTGAAIGGGIGWNSAGGYASVSITGGKVYAKNHGEIYTKGGNPTKDTENYDEVVGGVAIGAGSSFKAAGNTSPVVINISGGEVEAYGTFGNGIGGGNSSSAAGGEAVINISGGKVTASSIGGGDSKKGTGGAATVNISGSANVNLVKIDGIDQSGSIGGGAGGTVKAKGVESTGGKATVTVTGGILTCAGNIGGGIGGAGGNGGDAVITVSGGTLTAQSIGGGQGGTVIDGVGGVGGAAKVTFSESDGPSAIVKTGSIGGGPAGEGGKIGYATADISGGDISGQFLMASGGTAPCYFKMTGGVLHGVNTSDTSQFSYVQQDGAAVYMDDPNGSVLISGGSIEDCSARNGGAIYMTAGTFTLSGTGAIKNCKASEDGGAVYLGGGNVVVTGGGITANEAAGNGGGIYVKNGNYRMVGGCVDGNTAKAGDGGGIYVSAAGSNVTVDVLSGSVSGNKTPEGSGGAFAVVGQEGGSEVIDVTVGVNDIHFDESGKRVTCEHADTLREPSASTCPIIKDNEAAASGGAVYVAGGINTQLSIFCVTEQNNTEIYGGEDEEQSTFMKMEGGKVVISASKKMEVDGDGNAVNQDDQHGSINISGNMYVTGGQIDLWGSTDNPHIAGVMTVDIAKQEDHFLDHRANKGYYKLVYFENFKDPATGVVTGQYKAVDIPMGSTHVISGVIYSHPGYVINGWYTDKNGADGEYSEKHGFYDDKTLGKYDAAEPVLFDGNPIGNLTIYADWLPVGYEVHFDPNVPEGESYTGLMGMQVHTYGTPQHLTANAFGRVGWEFVEWNTEKDGSGSAYADGAEVLNLTTQRGQKVTLYAQWERCDHDPAKHVYVYSVVDEGKTLRRDCSCKVHYETAALSASDCVYDKGERPAQRTCSNESWQPEVAYAKAGDPSYDGAIPKNAGTYTASVTVTNVVVDDKGTLGDLTASVTYTIEKAEQDAPGKPEYEESTVDGVKVLNVKPVAISPLGDPSSSSYDEGYDAFPQYQVVYYENDILIGSDIWVPTSRDGVVQPFELPAAYTDYYVYARYSEGENYKASEPAQADTVYYLSGNAFIVVEPGEGVEYRLREAESGDAQSGATLTLTVKEGYYLPDGFKVTATTNGGAGDQAKWETGGSEWVLDLGSSEPYASLLSGIPQNSTVVVKIDDAVKATTAKAFVEPGQVFGGVSETSAVVSRDSAYTAYFEVSAYSHVVYGSADEGKAPAFKFSNALPSGTNLILVDKGTAPQSYYGYTAMGEVGELPLSRFTRMGTTGTNAETFEIAADATELRLQLIVDFSAVSNGEGGDASSVELCLTADKGTQENPKNANAAATVSATATAGLRNVSEFTLSATDVNGLTKAVNLGYTASQGAASKWLGRGAALVLLPQQGVELPADARISYTAGGVTATAYPTSSDAFYIPLTGFAVGQVSITLESSLMEGGAEYAMNAKWMASLSEAATSPVNGDTLRRGAVFATAAVTFAADAAAKPSVEVECFDAGSELQRVVAKNGKLTATVEWTDVPAGCDMTLTLMRKGNGGYASTAWERAITSGVVNSETGVYSSEVLVELNGAFEPGSYCLQLSVMQGLVEIASDRYYFIIEDQSQA